MMCSINNETKRNAYMDSLCERINEQAADIRQRIEIETSILNSKQRALERLESKKKKSASDQEAIQLLQQEIPDLEKKIKTLKGLKLFTIQVSILKKQVAENQRRRKAELEKKRMNAEFSKKIQSADDAGLPNDFKGSINDVFDAIEYGIFVHKEKYWSKSTGAAISNFTMRIIYHTDTGDEKAFRVISLKNVYGREKVISLNTDDFVSLSSFKKIISRRGDYVFKGNDSDLSRLQEYLQKDEISTKYVETLGFNKRGNF